MVAQNCEIQVENRKSGRNRRFKVEIMLAMGFKWGRKPKQLLTLIEFSRKNPLACLKTLEVASEYPKVSSTFEVNLPAFFSLLNSFFDST